MPELAEVKISSDQIKPWVLGKQIINAIPGNTGRYHQNNPEGFEAFLKEINSSPKVLGVRTHGKLMIWDFSNDFHMLCNFGMTGRWICQDVQWEMEKHACFSLDLNDGKRMVFLDPRHFGSIKFLLRQEELDQKLATLGWDCLQEELTEQVLSDISCKLKGNRVIASVLLDQSVFSGVGNYIRAEALYDAKISPWKKAGELSQQELKTLCLSLIKIVSSSYQHQGATLRTYKDAFGNEGKYSSFFQVYGRKTDPDGKPVKKEKTPEGRMIHWVPDVQNSTI